MTSAPWPQLPPFTAYGVLPQGDYPMTLDELRQSALVTGGIAVRSTWDGHWRADLIDRLAIVVQQLWAVGIDAIYIDGSFVEQKDHPNDIDGYFECDVRYLASGRLEQDLNALDPYQAWTWDERRRIWDNSSGKRQLPLWHQYRVELYPHFGQPTGILDRFGNQLQFPSAFRVSRRSYMPKGIIRLAR